MTKKSQKTTKKKGEFFFNFNQLRKKLNPKQKQKLITFFGNFRTMFLTVKQHLFQVNKMYDLMEQEYKRFQRDLFKDDEYLSNPKQNNEVEAQKEGEEFQLDDDIMKQILDEELKDENEQEEEQNDKEKNIENIKEESKNKKFLENYDIVLDEENSEEKNEDNNDKKPGEKFSQQLFDWRKKNK
jgi:hypothetical protein